MTKHEAKRILQRLNELQAEFDDYLLAALHAESGERAENFRRKMERVDGIMYGICYVLTIQQAGTLVNKRAMIETLEEIAQ